MAYRWMLFFCCFAFCPLAQYAEDSALQRLLQGNKAFVSNKDNERRQFYKGLLEGQEPIACLLTCSDSRIDNERLFNQEPGSLFIVRVAGNVAGPIETESIHFAVDVLHVPLLIVMGHQHCGAVAAAKEGKAYLIPTIAKHIDNNIMKLPHGASLDEAIKENALAQARQLRRDAVVARHIQKRGLQVLAAYYDVEKGTVYFHKTE